MVLSALLSKKQRDTKVVAQLRPSVKPEKNTAKDKTISIVASVHYGGEYTVLIVKTHDAPKKKKQASSYHGGR